MSNATVAEPGAQLKQKQVCARKRIMKEIQELSQDKEIEGQVWVDVNDDNIMEMVGHIKGPPDTPYFGGEFIVNITFPNDYPFHPPVIRFKNRIWHPNVSSVSGFICLDILGRHWSASMSLKTVLLSLQVLLQCPQPDDPQDATVAKQMLNAKKKFEETARYWTWNFAKPSGSSVELPEILKSLETKVADAMKSKGLTREEAVTVLSNRNWRAFPKPKQTKPTEQPTRQSTRTRRGTRDQRSRSPN